MGNNSVKILYAGFGWVNQVYEVTEKIQQALDAGKRSFFATNDWAGDPAFGHQKGLFIVWKSGDDDSPSQFGITIEGEPGIVINAQAASA